MVLPNRRRRDLNEPSLRPELGDICCSEVSHAGAQAADQLINETSELSLVGDSPLDPFWDELLCRSLVVFSFTRRLSVTIGRTLHHRAERSHASVPLKAAALVQDHLAG